MSVSVLLATYNSAKFLQPLIDSILNQSHQDLRLLIRDDGSTDSTLEIIQSYTDERIVCIPNQSTSKSAQNNFFSLLLACDDAYIMFADSDDVWMPRKVEITLDCMTRMESLHGNTTPILVHTDLRVTNKNLRIIDDSLFRYEKISPKRTRFNQLLAQNVVTGCTIMINRCLRQYVNKQPDSSVMHDWWLALIASAFGKIALVDEPTILYRQHGNNQVGAYNARNLSAAAAKLSRRADIARTYASMFAQAGCFAETFQMQMPSNLLEACRAYALMPHMNKMQRMMTICKYGFYKNTFERNAAQFFVI